MEETTPDTGKAGDDARTVFAPTATWMTLPGTGLELFISTGANVPVTVREVIDHNGRPAYEACWTASSGGRMAVRAAKPGTLIRHVEMQPPPDDSSDGDPPARS